MNANNVLGHTFSGDESASFLAGVEMTKIESKLAADQAVSNATNAKEHADQLTEHITANDTKEIKERNSRVADELNKTLTDFANTIESSSPAQSDVNTKASSINDLLSEVVSARIDKEQLDNVTVKALVVNDLVGESLEHYGSALGMAEEGHDENESNSTSSEHKENQNNETASIVDVADYQSAQAAVSRAIELYNEIKPAGDSNSSQLADSLNTLKSKIDSKSAFDEIDKIAGEKVSPVLNDMFKLNLAEEEEHSQGEDHAREDDHG
ncbi:MAG: hypothetical protein QN721_07695 [Nitrososphaeraceae archaeon]|nr:hypothetical protein [Nitrososphaeraceae archaeon]